jgi:predicted Zn-dependent peptidase
MKKCRECELIYSINIHSSKLSDNHSIHVIYNRPQNPSKSADTLEAAMTAQGIV